MERGENRGICFLSDSLGGTASHGGYFRIASEVSRRVPSRVISSRHPFFERAAGKFISLAKGWGKRSQVFSFLEWQFLRSIRNRPGFTHHILSADWHWECLLRCPESIAVATIHMPCGLWTSQAYRAISRLKGAIVLSTREYNAAARVLAADRIRLIKHPVDTSFFSPGNPGAVRVRSLLFVGGFLRDVAFFSSVALALFARDRIDEVHIVTTRHLRESQDAAGIANHARVIWHHGIPDAHLLRLYRSSALAFCPFIDSTANNAVVEALATGCPLVTTDNGGSRDYAGDDCTILVSPGDVAGAADTIVTLLDNHGLRATLSSKARAYAEAKLSYREIARQHVEFYDSLEAISKKTRGNTAKLVRTASPAAHTTET
jgi:glycosyltransferase involved in cell wall biosynthesis